MEDRKCLECSRTIYGRKDKKFCDDSCRNNYNNHQNRENTNIIRKINRILKKNRQVLEEVSGLTDEKRTHKTHREILLNKGFRFDFLTSIYTTKEGKKYYYVYNYGYMDLGNDFFLIVKKSPKK